MLFSGSFGLPVGIAAADPPTGPLTVCGPIFLSSLNPFSSGTGTCASGNTFVAVASLGGQMVSPGPWVTATGATPLEPSEQGIAGISLNAPVVGAATGNQQAGYWLATADGGVLTVTEPSASWCGRCFAPSFYGSMGGQRLNSPIVGIVSTVDGDGYWLVAADGGVFSFGDAGFYGSMAGHHLNAPAVGIHSSGDGYSLVAADGGIFAFGGARFEGSAVGLVHAPVFGMILAPGVSDSGACE